jgi:hypothetical protein
MIQRFKDSKIQGFKNSRIQKFKDSKIQGFKDSKIGKLENWNDGIVGSRRKWINWKYPPINPIPPISPIYPIPYTQYFFPLMIR